MIAVEKTEDFEKWQQRLRDRTARDRVLVRIRRLSLGNPGQVEAVGEGVSEMKIDYGPGYRIYFVRRGDGYLLLCGGDKSSQERDIRKAKALAVALRG
jgi:putative addiction module killer protein